MTSKQRPASGTIQAQILEQLREVKGKVDESLKQGADNGKQIELIRLALGMDGSHGLLPELEKAIARIDRNQESDHKELCARVDSMEREHESRIDALEDGDQRAQGGKQLWSMVRSFIGGSAGAAAIGILAKMLGLIH